MQPTAIVLTIAKFTFAWRWSGERGTNELMQGGDAGDLLVQNPAQSKLVKAMSKQIFNISKIEPPEFLWAACSSV